MLNAMNAITIDFEDWFAPKNMPGFDKLNWADCDIRIEEPTKYLLELLKSKSITAVFFVLGYIADKKPDLIKLIGDYGHEIASHGYSHTQITKQSEKEFEQDIEMSLDALSKIGFTNIQGYRAPSFSITKDTLWAIDILKKYGIQYSSSIYPTNLRKEYGIAEINREIFRHENGIIELPMNSAKIGGRLIPCSGGAYFRFYPYPLFRKLKQISDRQTNHYIFYLHPWELDAGQPLVDTNITSRIRHYYNIKNVSTKLERLVSDLDFVPMQSIISDFNSKI